MSDLQVLYAVNDKSQVIPLVVYEEGDKFIHTVEHPYCDDSTCPCGGRPQTNEEETGA